MRRFLLAVKNGYRRFSSVSESSNNLVLVESKANSRTAILNRPSSLNALNTSTVARLQELYKDWENDPDVGFVVLKGGGNAFSAGGDIVTLYNLIKQGKQEECRQLVRVIYNFVSYLGNYPKPHVALLNGITMGGAGGISIPGQFRVATSKTIFATPEALIGFHPDAGASFYLSHSPGYLGEYLALTGDTLNGREMLSCGLATHYSSTQELSLVEEQLGNLVTGNPTVIETDSGNHRKAVGPHKRIETINKCFSHDTVEEIVDSLENEAAKSNDVFCVSSLKKLKEASPLSLKVSLRSIREGRFQTLDQCVSREHGTTLHVIAGQMSKDFSEGVRAKLIDKDLAPKWDPPTLELVPDDMVDAYFSSPPGFEAELERPPAQQKAFA